MHPLFWLAVSGGAFYAALTWIHSELGNGTAFALFIMFAAFRYEVSRMIDRKLHEHKLRKPWGR